MITQECLGQMLGARRSTISVSAGILQRAGLIRYSRGHVTIVDREGLIAVSCECYAVIKAELDMVIARTRREPSTSRASHRHITQMSMQPGTIDRIAGALVTHMQHRNGGQGVGSGHFTARQYKVVDDGRWQDP